MKGDHPVRGDERITILGPGDESILDRVAEGVFDGPVRPALTREFIEDGRHHLAIAIAGEQVVGFASAVHYVHPDKDPELWINEIGVAPTHRRRGLAKRLLAALFDVGSGLGCTAGWVLTSRSNGPARRAYESAGGTEDPDPIVMYEFRLGRSPDPEGHGE